MKITNNMVEYAYYVAKQVYGKTLSRSEGKEKIYKETGMNPGSTNDYISVLLDMMNGNEYHRTINNFATKYYFENIKKDFGNEALNKAIHAADKHTKYYSGLGRGNLTGIEQIIKEFKNVI